jgi:hypothetical protein
MKKSRMPILGAAGALAGVVLIAGCAKQQSVVAPAPVLAAKLPVGLTPEASVLDLMLEVIDPNADELWESVATISTRTGVEERHPRTDAEWKAVRRKALLLVEAANLLVVEGRPVAHPGQNRRGRPHTGAGTAGDRQGSRQFREFRGGAADFLAQAAGFHRQARHGAVP